jgi:Domain of unknown function (DUF4878)
MRRIALSTIILLLIFAILASACTTPSVADRSPPGVLNTYVKAVNDRDTRTVHDALSSALRSRFDHDYATTRRDPVYDALHALELMKATMQSVTIINMTTTNKTSVIEVDFFWHYPGVEHGDERRQIVHLVNEGGEWKLDDFFPFDGPDIPIYPNY